MKNIFQILIAVAVLFTASCAKEDISSSVGGGEVEMTFTVDLQNLGSRAIGDYGTGKEVNTLRVFVYDGETHLPDLNRTEPIAVGNTTTVSLPLIKGMTYNIVFWADRDGYYTYDPATKSISIDYSTVTANEEWRDAFCKYVAAIDPATAKAEDRDIVLTRPFAQLNAVTSDLDKIGKSGVTLSTSTVTLDTYSTLNLATGEVSGLTEDVTLVAGNVLPNGHLSMNYLLAPAEGYTTDIVLTIDNNKNIDFGTSYHYVPLKRNYRTNILGKLLTATTDFTVTIEAAFGVPDIEEWEQIADGVVLMNDTYLITSLEGLKWFAEETDGVTRAGGNTFEGKTVQLGVDIDLENNPWTPIASNGVFKGVFDGGNHTIKNLKVEVADKTPVGLFANARNVKNLKLENVDVRGHYKAGAVVGDGLCAKIENCHVKNAYIEITPLNEDDGNHAGGIVGYLSAETVAYVKNCSVTDANIVAYRDCGGIAGTATGGSMSPVVEKNSLKNVEVVANQLDPYYAEKDANVGEVVGRNPKSIDLTSNICDNVKTDILKVVDNQMSISTAPGLTCFSDAVDEKNTFEGTTIKLENDIDVSAENWNPIGDNRTDAAFSGIFDGQGHTINGAHITGDHCFNGNVYGSKEGWGLFSVLDGATVKNLKIDEAVFGSYTVISGSVAGYAHNTTFENIDISNSKIAGYNWYTGGVVGWATGECTFKDINLDNKTSVGTLWDSHGQCAGGIAGGIDSEAKITIEDCNIACVLDVINDVTSNYKWYIYRVSGMIIGNTNTTETKYNEVVTATATNVTCKNVTVTYGDWMNYHYCEEYGNRGWGRVEESEYVGFGIPNEHTHSDGKEHYVCLPFDQLFGGSSNGSGHYPVKGLAEFPGVTVNYPDKYTCSVCGMQHNVE